MKLEPASLVKLFGDRVASDGTSVAGNFEKWFGKSQAVDPSGAPMVLLHGTPERFDSFEPSARGSFGAGIYLSTDRKQAEMYAERSEDGLVMKLFVSMQRPFHTEADYDLGETLDLDVPWVPLMLALWGEDASWRIDHAAAGDGKLGDEVRRRLIELGYDGIIATYSDGNQEFVAFDACQLKSATDNSGLFDASSLDMADRHGELMPERERLRA